MNYYYNLLIDKYHYTDIKYFDKYWIYLLHQNVRRMCSSVTGINVQPLISSTLLSAVLAVEVACTPLILLITLYICKSLVCKCVGACEQNISFPSAMVFSAEDTFPVLKQSKVEV